MLPRPSGINMIFEMQIKGNCGGVCSPSEPLPTVETAPGQVHGLCPERDRSSSSSGASHYVTFPRLPLDALAELSSGP